MIDECESHRVRILMIERSKHYIFCEAKSLEEISDPEWKCHYIETQHAPKRAGTDERFDKSPLTKSFYFPGDLAYMQFLYADIDVKKKSAKFLLIHLKK